MSTGSETPAAMPDKRDGGKVNPGQEDEIINPEGDQLYADRFKNIKAKDR